MMEIILLLMSKCLKSINCEIVTPFFFCLQVPGRGFVNTWVGVFKNVKSIRPGDAAVGFACIGILLFLRVRREMSCVSCSNSVGPEYSV